jgi:hypothetical protein
MSRVRVTIDRLALKGFEPDQRRGLVDGLQSELARVLADRATRDWADPRHLPVLRLGQAAIEPGSPGGRRFGAGMARRIAREAMNNARDRR